MFWFLLISLAVVVAAVALAVLGSRGGPGGTAVGGLADAPPDLLDEPLPEGRPVDRADVDALRLPVAVRGYRMRQVDDVLDRLGAELAERDARIAELESALAGARAPAPGAPGGPFAAPASPGPHARYAGLEDGEEHAVDAGPRGAGSPPPDGPGLPYAAPTPTPAPPPAPAPVPYPGGGGGLSSGLPDGDTAGHGPGAGAAGGPGTDGAERHDER